MRAVGPARAAGPRERLAVGGAVAVAAARVAVTGPASPSPRPGTGRSPASVSRRRWGAGRVRPTAQRAGLSKELRFGAGPGPPGGAGRGPPGARSWRPAGGGARGGDGESAFGVLTLDQQDLLGPLDGI